MPGGESLPSYEVMAALVASLRRELAEAACALKQARAEVAEARERIALGMQLIRRRERIQRLDSRLNDGPATTLCHPANGRGVPGIESESEFPTGAPPPIDVVLSRRRPDPRTHGIHDLIRSKRSGRVSKDMHHLPEEELVTHLFRHGDLLLLFVVGEHLDLPERKLGAHVSGKPVHRTAHCLARRVSIPLTANVRMAAEKILRTPVHFGASWRKAQQVAAKPPREGLTDRSPSVVVPKRRRGWTFLRSLRIRGRRPSGLKT